jgi:hypothetical protein
VTNNLNTLATALYVKVDDVLKASPELAPWRPAVGIAPTLSDVELVTLAVMSALLGYTSERRWLRRARSDVRHLFPYLPQQSGYNKRLRAASSLITHMIRLLAKDTSLDVRLLAGDGQALGTWPDGPSTATARRTRGSSGACACTWCAPWAACRCCSRSPARRPTSARHCATCWTSRPMSWPRTRARPSSVTRTTVAVRVLLRVLALTAAIWLNDKTGQPAKRSLITYDH